MYTKTFSTYNCILISALLQLDRLKCQSSPPLSPPFSPVSSPSPPPTGEGGGDSWNRPLARRGHVTNASFKQCVGILLMPKIDRAHKNYLTTETWEETRLREIFYSTLIFQQSSMICTGRHVGGHSLALQHGGQNYFLLISCQRLIVTLRCAVNITTLSFHYIFLEV